MIKLMDKSKQPIRIEISYKTVVFIALFTIGLWLLIQIRQIIILVFLSIILLSALHQPVDWLTAKRIPRILSIAIVYILLIAAIAFVVGTIIPPLISQTTEFVSRLPQIAGTINDFLIFNKIPVSNLSDVISKQAQQVAGDIVLISTTIISSIFLIVTMFVLSLYLLIDWKTFIRVIESPFSGMQEKKVIILVSKIERGLGMWVRGQLALSLLVGVLTYIGLTILGIPFALPLALVAGIMEIIPIIGPIISSVPAILVGLTISPVMALATAALFFIVQQMESHLVVPVVMSKVVGLQPAAVIIALLIGAKLNGIGGAFLAIPTIIVAKIIIKDFISDDRKTEEVVEV